MVSDIMMLDFIPIFIQFLIMEIIVTVVTIYNMYLLWFSPTHEPDTYDNFVMTLLWGFVWVGSTVMIIIGLLSFPPS